MKDIVWNPIYPRIYKHYENVGKSPDVVGLISTYIIDLSINNRNFI